MKCQHLRDLGADQRGAKTRVLPRPGKLPRLQGGNQGAGPKNWRKRKKRASPRSPQKRSSDRAVPPASSPRSSFLLGLDRQLRSHCPRPFPQAHTSPPPTCVLTTTLHSTPAAAGPWWPEWGAVFLWSQFPASPLTHEHILALLDKANFLLSRTLRPLRPHSLSGRDIADWAPGLGVPSPPTLLLASH